MSAIPVRISVVRDKGFFMAAIVWQNTGLSQVRESDNRLRITIAVKKENLPAQHLGEDKRRNDRCVGLDDKPRSVGV